MGPSNVFRSMRLHQPVMSVRVDLALALLPGRLLKPFHFYLLFNLGILL